METVTNHTATPSTLYRLTLEHTAAAYCPGSADDPGPVIDTADVVNPAALWGIAVGMAEHHGVHIANGDDRGIDAFFAALERHRYPAGEGDTVRPAACETPDGAYRFTVAVVTETVRQRIVAPGPVNPGAPCPRVTSHPLAEHGARPWHSPVDAWAVAVTRSYGGHGRADRQADACRRWADAHGIDTAAVDAWATALAVRDRDAARTVAA